MGYIESSEPVEPGVALVADDDPAIRELVAEWLRAEGWTVLEAADGITAVALGAGAGAGLALLVTDLEMPGLGGREVVAGVRAVRPDIRVVLISGRDRRDLEAGSPLPVRTQFLSKPFNASALSRACAAAGADREIRPDAAGPLPAA